MEGRPTDKEVGQAGKDEVRPTDKEKSFDVLLKLSVQLRDPTLSDDQKWSEIKALSESDPGTRSIVYSLMDYGKDREMKKSVDATKDSAQGSLQTSVTVESKSDKERNETYVSTTPRKISVGRCFEYTGIGTEKKVRESRSGHKAKMQISLVFIIGLTGVAAAAAFARCGNVESEHRE